MTHGRFIIFGLAAVILTTLVKLFFITTLNIDSSYIVYLMWFLIALISIGCCRRLGVISYLEAVLVLGIWLLFSLILDLLILSTIIGNDIYRHSYLWIAYAVMAVSVFLSHKKRHVEVRKLLIEKYPPKPPVEHH